MAEDVNGEYTRTKHQPAYKSGELVKRQIMLGHR